MSYSCYDFMTLLKLLDVMYELFYTRCHIIDILCNYFDLIITTCSALYTL